MVVTGFPHSHFYLASNQPEEIEGTGQYSCANFVMDDEKEAATYGNATVLISGHANASAPGLRPYTELCCAPLCTVRREKELSFFL